MPQKKWSKEIVVEHILKRHRGEKKLSSDYMTKNHRALYQAACFYCGSWKSAIEAAGLSYDDVRIKTPSRKRVWSEDVVIRTIQKLRATGKPLNSNYIQKNNQRLYGAANRFFGSWKKAVEAAGLKYSSVQKMELRSWTKKIVVDEIMRRHREGLSIKGESVSKEDRGLYKAAHRHFGENGWQKARVLAGFEPVDPLPFKIWDEQTVCNEIVRLHQSGVPLYTAALQNSAYSYLLAAGRKVFGSWAKAIRAAGLDYSKIRKGRHQGWWTKARIIMCIKNLEQQGVRLSSKSIQSSHGALFGAAIVRFGCWSKAVEAAGISYRQHALIWSTKAWLRNMEDDEYESLLEKASNHIGKRSR